MHLNADFSQAVVLDTTQILWDDSPMAGVQRRKLDRIGDELARATSLVRYAPQSYFSPHTHSGCEEIYVIDGTFSDENGDYPKGTWLPSPHMSVNKLFSKDGCLLYVKTGHLPLDETS